MKIKDQLARIYKETFLDLFDRKPVGSDDLGSALAQARSNVEKATDALAAFMLTDLQLQEQRLHLHQQIDALTLQLENALTANKDDEARDLIGKRQSLQKQMPTLDVQADTSHEKKCALKEQLDSMKTHLMEIERKKLDLELRNRAAGAIDQINRAEVRLEQAQEEADRSETERKTLHQETINALEDEHKNTLSNRADALIATDDIEQELARLKKR